MRNYYYTDKLLLCLAVSNLWMLIPTGWGIWWNFSFIEVGQGDKSQIVTTILLSTAEWLLVLLLTTFAFFKGWRWVVIFYVIYLSDLIPSYIATLITYWKINNNLSALGSSVYGYTYVFIWLLGLITSMVLLIETDYKDLFKRLRNCFIHKARRI